jgi:hypothetical protein
MRAFLVLFGCAAAALAGTEPKPKPEDYPVRAQAGDVTIAAEYMVHSFAGQGQTFVAEGYLTVEVALFPRAGAPLEVNPAGFTLRINGKKRVILSQAPWHVAGSLKYPDWERRPTLTASGGIGDAGVTVGRPRSVERFPDDPRPRQERLPQPPRAPDAQDRSGLDPRERVRPEELVSEVALPEGPARGPVAGYLYFASREKASRIRSVELLYGDAVLKLK